MAEIKTTMTPMGKITVASETDGGLRCNEWDFITHYDRLRCTGFRKMSRQTKRHKFRVDEEYDSSHYLTRWATYRGAGIVVQSDDIVAAAKDRLIESILALLVEWPKEASDD